MAARPGRGAPGPLGGGGSGANGPRYQDSPNLPGHAGRTALPQFQRLRQRRRARDGGQGRVPVHPRRSHHRAQRPACGRIRPDDIGSRAGDGRPPEHGGHAGFCRGAVRTLPGGGRRSGGGAGGHRGDCHRRQSGPWLRRSRWRDPRRVERQQQLRLQRR
ncbi:MAG TPA: hypothetical protein DEQ98_02400 [Acidobacteria bacterium]|nr:hypothetical protein [Acidobacteriota bacterium]